MWLSLLNSPWQQEEYLLWRTLDYECGRFVLVCFTFCFKGYSLFFNLKVFQRPSKCNLMGKENAQTRTEHKDPACFRLRCDCKIRCDCRKYINVLLIEYSESKVMYFSVRTGAEFDLLLCKTSFLLTKLAQGQSPSSPWLLPLKEANPQEGSTISTPACVHEWSILVRSWHKERCCCEVNGSQSILNQEAFEIDQFRDYWKHSRLATPCKGQFLIFLCYLSVFLLFQGYQHKCHITGHLLD